MESLAINLREEREKKKISLAQIAADTRISLRHLQSIEEGRYGDLPGGVYNRAFIKAYCESIKIDPREFLERYDAEVSSSDSEKSQKSVIAPPRQKSFFIPIPVLIWSIMLLISAIGLFFSRGWISDIFAPYFSEKAVSDIEYQAPAGVPEASESNSGDIAATGVSKSPLTTDISDNSKAAAGSRAPSLSERPAETGSDAVRSEPPPDPKLRLEIVATEQCWISVDIDGQPASRRLMEPGEQRSFNAAERLFILLGNAGGVQLKLNGKPTKPLGDPGEVIKMNVDLENLQQFLNISTG
jgi:cytoskeleton protein RodZ